MPVTVMMLCGSHELVACFERSTIEHLKLHWFQNGHWGSIGILTWDSFSGLAYQSNIMNNVEPDLNRGESNTDE
jgi:hypothetical protein